MRVLLINPILYTSETDEIPKVKSIKDTMIYTMCLGFLENGDIPVLVAAKDYMPENEEKYPFEVIWMDTALKKIFKPRCLPWLPKLGIYIKRHRDEIDGIITSEVFSLCSLTAVRKQQKKTIVWHELGAHNKMMHYIPSKIWYYLVAGIFFQKVTVVARSENAKRFIGKFCPQVLENVIDHGVNIREIKPGKRKENHFVVVSQLIRRKRIDKTIEVFADFTEQGGEQANYILDVIGTGDLEPELKKRAAELKVEDKVIFHGRMTHGEMMPIVAAAKAMLVYTEKDNSMVSIVESIAAGTPVVTTTVPFNADYIKREKLGIVKDCWDKSVLDRICDENEEYVQNCMAYREKLSADYGAGEFVKILKRMEKELC